MINGQWKWLADGDANHYHLLTADGKNWVAAVKMNGEMLASTQEKLIGTMTAGPEFAAAAMLALRTARPVSASEVAISKVAFGELRAALARAQGESPK